jgi:hypothetical protein
VRENLFTGLDEMVRVGLQYLPPVPGQPEGMLHMAWGQHHHDQGSPSATPSHAMCSLDFSQPETAGAWWISDVSLYSVTAICLKSHRTGRISILTVRAWQQVDTVMADGPGKDRQYKPSPPG